MGVARDILLEKAKAHYLFVLASLCLLTRSLVDLAHLPLYLDTTGVLVASMVLGPLHGLLTALIASLFLSAYYAAYAFLTPFLCLLGFVFGYLYRRGNRIALLSVPLGALIYQVGWLCVYTSVMGVWEEFGSYMASAGGFGLLADLTISAFVASLISEAIGRSRERLKNIETHSWLLLATAISLLILAPVSAILNTASEEVFKEDFPEEEGYIFRCTRMDLVWLPMWCKGTNYYYYPEDRFDRKAPGYQVWIGMYWVQGRIPLTVETVAMFAIWDQNAWLRLHGCPRPYTTIAIVENITEITFKGYKAKLMYGSLYTRSDVEPYEDLRLDGFFIVFYDAGRDRTGIIYACATQENFEDYLPELWRVVNKFPIGH